MSIRARLGALALALLAIGCGDGSDPAPPAAIGSVTISSSAISLRAGQVDTLTASVQDVDGNAMNDAAITWASSATHVATVSEAGVVTAVGAGVAAVSATSGEVVGRATVNVSPPIVPRRIAGTVELVNEWVGTVNAGAQPPSMRRPAGARISAMRPDRGTRAPGMPKGTRPHAVPGEWVVTLKPAALGAVGAHLRRGGPGLRTAVAAVLESPGARGLVEVMGVSPHIGAMRVRVPQGAGAQTVLAGLRANPAVLAVEPNYLYRRMGDPVAAQRGNLPGDALYPLQSWQYVAMDLPRAWELTTGSTDILVAVVDDGIRFDHPEIAANLTADGYDFVTDTATLETCPGVPRLQATGDGDGPDPDPTNPVGLYSTGPIPYCLAIGGIGNHGLHVAGTIGAVGDDGLGATGVNWRVRIRPVRALTIDGYGTMYDLIQGILYAAGLAADAGGTLVTAPSAAHVINMSFGGPEGTTAMGNAIQAAADAGSVLVGASGNYGGAMISYPAAYADVVSVAAVDPTLDLASYSGYYGETVDVAAPGGDYFGAGIPALVIGTLSTAWDYSSSQPAHATWVGTSMSTAHVSGVAALVLAQNPGMTAAQVRQRIEAGANDLGPPGRDMFMGHGLVNALNALTGTDGTTPTVHVYLVSATTGATMFSTTTDASGAYEFLNVPDGNWYVYARQDEDGGAIAGRSMPRWGAVGGAPTPTVVSVSDTSDATGDIMLGQALERDANDLPVGAGVIPVGGYLVGLVEGATDVDMARVMIPVAGRYTFETEGLGGACGFGVEANTRLELQDASGASLGENLDIDATNRCSRITRDLAPGTYFLVVRPEGDVPLRGVTYVLSVREGE